MELKDVLERYTQRVPEEELKERVARLKERLEADVAVLVHPPDIYYYAGSKQEGLLMIPKNGEPHYLVFKHAERASWECPFNVVPVKSARKLPEAVSELGIRTKRVATELDVITLSAFNRLKKVFPDAEFVDVSPTVRQQKAVKSPWEIGVLKRCAEIVKGAYERVKKELREGITEVELSALAICEARRLGHEFGETMRGGRMEGFAGHILSGHASVVPSYMNAPLNGIGLSPAMPGGPSRKGIERGETVLFDFFGTHMGYLVDMTRTLGLSPIPEKLKSAYSVVLEMHNYLKENMKAGTDALDIYNAVVKIAEDSGLADNFMGYPGNRVGFIGHGVGTEINDFPFLAKGLEMELKENMVVAVEPKFLFPDLGAVGLENTYLITKEGAVSLTDAPEELFEK